MALLLEGLLCRFAFLVLPCAALGGIASTVDNQLNHIGQLSTANQFLSRSDHLHRQHPIIALQSSLATHLKAGAAQTLKAWRVGRTAKRSRLQRLLRRQEQMSRRQKQAMQKLGACRGLKLKWWIKIKKKCSKAYGPDSKWDRNRLDGKCAGAWNSCNTGFYAVCCTQPVGPKNLAAYCEKANLTAEEGEAANDDKACEVQGSVDDLHQTVESIKDTVKLMDKVHEEEPVVEEIVRAPVVVVRTTPEPAVPSPGPMPGPAVAPLGITGKAPAAAPQAIVLGPPEFKPSKLMTRCEKLDELTREAMEKINSIKSWAKRDGIERGGRREHPTGPQEIEEDITEDIEEANPENPEAKDPDLVFQLKGVLKMGEKLDALLKMGKFCNKEAEEEEEDDDDPIEKDLNKDPTKEWVSDSEEDEEDEEEEDVPVVKVNETALVGLLEWESDVKVAVNKFETQVHPHGYKWWRYRYEYTVVESIVLAFSVLLLYFMMWLMHGVSFFNRHKFYKTGLPQIWFRYAFIYFLFHAAALMVMVTLAYMLYIPWGKDNVFNAFAEAFHDWVGGRANVPFLGYSWLYMVLDVQFQLFACFALYSLFIVMVVHNFKTALRDWKIFSDEQDYPAVTNSVNVMLYKHFNAIVKRRVANTPEYRSIFKELKLSLPGSGIEEIDQLAGADWHEFKLHLYLTEALGKSIEYLCEVSLTTFVLLASCTLVVAYLADVYQVAFMYFLPGFVAIGFLLFLCGYGVSRYFRALCDDDRHKSHSKYVTMHSFCRAVQILLYCLFFSFSRLLLSNDIFEDYTAIYLSALIGLCVIMLLLSIFGGQVIKETCAALVLPPHVTIEVLHKQLLHQIVDWHKFEKCHECGEKQNPSYLSHSKEWAGQKKLNRSAAPSAAEQAYDSNRMYSWRG